MNKMKNILLSILLICFVASMTLCANIVYAKQEQPIKIWFQNSNGKMETYCVVDEKTGVNYIVVSGELYSEGIGTAITPRLNEDGTLFVTK